MNQTQGKRERERKKRNRKTGLISNDWRERKRLDEQTEKRKEEREREACS